jgi:metal-dependent amidase/aminoacylase/carboxypeptidase family protein
MGYSREATVQIVQQIAEFHDQLTEWRRDIHAHPELGFEEQRTSDLVAQRLAEFGYEVLRGIGKTGVVGRLRAGSSSRSIGLRADMDCLPIQETTNLPIARVTRGGCMPAVTMAIRRCC